ncbi:B-cell receptor-associated protein 31-like [Salvia splendens]|uniref:B-cell receptor-associated protein 31-like n=1 Tax=Salvia splendens TaxID=180675 RepID=UPI00110217EE|nr:B-cell receptor-associated protein 31-like [Salvia splendens]
MIQLLFSLVFTEMALIVAFVFKTPLRKLVIMGLDRLKRGRGPIVVKTIAGTLFLLMVSTVYNVVAIQRRCILDGAEVNPTDQVILAKHLLQASLMGFSLFLALMLDRLHHYIRELRIRRKSSEAVKKQNRIFDDNRAPAPEEIKVLEDEMSKLRGMVSRLEKQLQEKSKEAGWLEKQLQENSKEPGSAEANAMALKKQSEGFLLEYDRLLEENQNLRSQLRSLDRKFSFADGKKVM